MSAAALKEIETKTIVLSTAPVGIAGPREENERARAVLAFAQHGVRVRLFQSRQVQKVRVLAELVRDVVRHELGLGRIYLPVEQRTPIRTGHAGQQSAWNGRSCSSLRTMSAELLGSTEKSFSRRCWNSVAGSPVQSEPIQVRSTALPSSNSFLPCWPHLAGGSQLPCRTGCATHAQVRVRTRLSSAAVLQLATGDAAHSWSVPYSLGAPASTFFSSTSCLVLKAKSLTRKSRSVIFVNVSVFSMTRKLCQQLSAV